MKEDEILLAGIEDKIQQSVDYYIPTYSNFLDMRQRTLVERICKGIKGLRYLFYGGYEDAERTVVAFLPDYARLEDDNPLSLLRISQDGHRELSHRDYLGSLLGLGIKREMIGDILVRKDGADVIIIKEISDFLLFHYDKAGRTALQVQLLPMGELIVPEGHFEEKKVTVASLRLDNVVGSAFALSRTKASEAINGGVVYVNGLLTVKPDQPVKEGDKLVFRGRGKAILQKIGGTSKKDRVFIVIRRYL
jgi:RNA-binding protein YlmH